MSTRKTSAATVNAVWVTILVGLAPMLPAQSDPAVRELPLEEAVELAHDASPGLDAARAGISASSAVRSQARTAWLPALDLEISYMRTSEQDPAEIQLPDQPQGPGSVTLGEAIENRYGATVALRQPLFTGGNIAARIDGAGHAIAASRSRYRWERAGVELQVRTAYWRLVEAQLRVAAIEERLRQVEANLRNMNSRLANGVVTRSEVLTVEMKLAEARLQLLRAENSRELAGARLAVLIGLPADAELRPATTLDSADQLNAQAEPGELELEELIGEALAQRGDIAELRASLDAARTAETVAEAGWFPKLYLAGEYTYARPNPTRFPAEDAFESSWRIGIVGRVALGDMPRVYHESSQREAEGAGAAARLQAAEDRVRLAVRQAYLSWQSSATEVELAQTMVRQAQENVADTRGRVDNGVALNEDLLEAQATLLEARLALTSARTGRRIAWDRLMRERGVDP